MLHGAPGTPVVIAWEHTSMWSPQRVVVVLLLVLAGAYVGGCNSKADQARDGDTSPVSMDADAVRQRYMRLNPENRVGVVNDVRASAHLAAVGEIPLQDFGIGDVLVFIDALEQPFNSGEVVNATADALHVRFDANRRAPRVGELAVRLR